MLGAHGFGNVFLPGDFGHQQSVVADPEPIDVKPLLPLGDNPEQAVVADMKVDDAGAGAECRGHGRPTCLRALQNRTHPERHLLARALTNKIEIAALEHSQSQTAARKQHVVQRKECEPCHSRQLNAIDGKTRYVWRMNRPSDFVAHGSSRFETHGQVLILHSTGPFNAEHILSLAEPFRHWAAVLRPNGPWASVNIVTVSAMCTPEAVQALRLSAQRSFDLLGRVAMSYVIAADVEGRRVMEPALRGSCAGIMPLELFEDIDPAVAWAETRIAAARAAPDGEPARA